MHLCVERPEDKLDSHSSGTIHLGLFVCLFLDFFFFLELSLSLARYFPSRLDRSASCRDIPVPAPSPWQYWHTPCPVFYMGAGF